MTVSQPSIPTWRAKPGEPYPGNLKVRMSRRVHFRPLLPNLAKNYSCYGERVDTDFRNRVAFTSLKLYKYYT